MAWFEALFGFPERDYKATQDAFKLRGSTLVTRTQPPKSFEVGTFSTPSLRELREEQAAHTQSKGPKLDLQVVVGDVSGMLCDAQNRLATFQVGHAFSAMHLQCVTECDVLAQLLPVRCATERLYGSNQCTLSEPRRCA